MKLKSRGAAGSLNRWMKMMRDKKRQRCIPEFRLSKGMVLPIKSLEILGQVL